MEIDQRLLLAQPSLIWPNSSVTTTDSFNSRSHESAVEEWHWRSTVWCHVAQNSMSRWSLKPTYENRLTRHVIAPSRAFCQALTKAFKCADCLGQKILLVVAALMEETTTPRRASIYPLPVSMTTHHVNTLWDKWQKQDVMLHLVVVTVSLHGSPLNLL